MQPLTRHLAAAAPLSAEACRGMKTLNAVSTGSAAAALGSIGAAGRGALRALRAWIDRLRLDARTRYLSASIDHADCERRVRNWDAHEQQRARRPWTC